MAYHWNEVKNTTKICINQNNCRQQWISIVKGSKYSLWSNGTCCQLCKVFNLVSNNINTTLIGGIQFQYSFFVDIAEQLMCGSQNRWCFSSTCKCMHNWTIRNKDKRVYRLLWILHWVAHLPGGPYSNKLGKSAPVRESFKTATTSFCSTTSSTFFGRLKIKII